MSEELRFVRAVVRAFISGHLMKEWRTDNLLNFHPTFEAWITSNERTLKKEPHMFEFELLDITDPNERFLRFGTDRTLLVQPVELTPEQLLRLMKPSCL